MNRRKDSGNQLQISENYEKNDEKTCTISKETQHNKRLSNATEKQRTNRQILRET